MISAMVSDREEERGMRGTEDATESRDLEGVRRRRAGLRRTMTAFEVATAAALVGRPQEWRTELLGHVDDLRKAWQSHVSGTEGPGGLWEQIRTDAPRLDGGIRRLRREHELMTAEVDGLRQALVDADEDEARLAGVRERATTLLQKLARHRQRGADLIFEAYQRDIGGNE
jgi:hypothetical protein